MATIDRRSCPCCNRVPSRRVIARGAGGAPVLFVDTCEAYADRVAREFMGRSDVRSVSGNVIGGEVPIS